jgi:hypothetical protein
MQKVDLELCCPLDAMQRDLVGIGGVKDLAIETTRAELFDTSDLQSKKGAQPGQYLPAGGVIAAVYHNGIVNLII